MQRALPWEVKNGVGNVLMRYVREQVSTANAARIEPYVISATLMMSSLSAKCFADSVSWIP